MADMTVAFHDKRKPGRKNKPEIEELRARSWFYQAGEEIGTFSGYQFEYIFSPHTIRKVDGITIRSRKFDHHKSGRHTPGPRTIVQTKFLCPKAAKLVNHPFWAIAKEPFIGLAALNDQYLILRPEIKSLLFLKDSNGLLLSERRNYDVYEILLQLEKEGDLDALAACIGIIQELRYFKDETFDFICAKTAFRIFKRLIGEIPFSILASELFEYLAINFFNNKIGRAFCNEVRSRGLGNLVQLARSKTIIMETIYSRDLLPMPLTSYFHIVEDLFTPAETMHTAERAKYYFFMEGFDQIGLVQLRSKIDTWHKKRCLDDTDIYMFYSQQAGQLKPESVVSLKQREWSFSTASPIVGADPNLPP